MMLHRHFEEDKAKRGAGMTRLSDVTPSTSTDPKDPTYVPVDGDNEKTDELYVEGEDGKEMAEPARKPGRPKKSN